MIPIRWIYRAWELSCRRQSRRFRRALAEPQRAQCEVLREIAGRRRFTSVTDFRAKTPLSTYEDYRVRIEAVRKGSVWAMGHKTTRLVPTGGSTGGRKLIPYTALLSRQMNRAVSVWMGDLLNRYPEIAHGPAYWSVSPAFESDAESSVPVGFEHDAEYLGSLLAPLVEAAFAVPSLVRQARSVEAFQYVSLLYLLRCRSLRVISVWHPSFLTVLLGQRTHLWERLVDDIRTGELHLPGEVSAELRRRLAQRLRPDPARALELEALGHGATPAEYWPSLSLISAWADASAAGPFRSLGSLFPTNARQPKGLLSTEAFVTVPYRERWPLALTSHFFEFLGDDGRAYLPWEVDRGGEYEVVVSTGGGLLRYRTGDLVRIDGRIGKTPSLRLVGRADAVVDLVGEKLSEAFVAQSLTRSGLADADFAMLAPNEPGIATGYTLFIDRPVGARCRDALESALRDNPHYGYARDLGQLAPLRVFHIQCEAHQRFLHRSAERGQVIGEIKATRLSSFDDWAHVFEGHLVTGPKRRQRPATEREGKAWACAHD